LSLGRLKAARVFKESEAVGLGNRQLRLDGNEGRP
jgi:hypothetical protein